MLEHMLGSDHLTLAMGAVGHTVRLNCFYFEAEGDFFTSWKGIGLTYFHT